MSILCTICARGGSKGVANKNIRPLHGKPLIAWTIAQAHESGIFDFVAVSSDSKDILSAAARAGADLLLPRPDDLATDNAAKLGAIRHAVISAEQQTGRRFDVLVDLDSTSPLRTSMDIVAAVELLRKYNAPNVITGMPARRSPYFNLVELNTDGFVQLSKKTPDPVVRRQDSPSCYDMNASIYVWQRDALFEDPAIFKTGTRLYVMPEERSVDIDSELDFKIVEMIFAERLS